MTVTPIQSEAHPSTARRLLTRAVFLLTAAAMLSALLLSQATPATVDPQLLQALQSLPPDLQAKVLQELRSGGSGVSDRPLSEPELVVPYPDRGRGLGRKERRPLGQDDLDALRRKDEQGELQPFGYFLFRGLPVTFAPATDIPVPANYVLGPGDTVQIQLFGKENVEYSLVVSRDGTLNFPAIGPIHVVGRRFDELKADLNKRIAEQMIGVRASITMGTLRSIRVFVLGDVNRPGSYTVSALSTMTNALFVSGGVHPIGSLRNVQLKRRGKVVTRLDLYDLMLRGDTSSDARLQPGDVLFVSPVGPTIGVDGEVRRPALYEIKGEKTVGDVVKMAGGLASTAYRQAAVLERIGRGGNRTLLDVDLHQDAGLRTAVRDGDVLRVYSVMNEMKDIVLLSGHVKRPGGYQWHKGMRLTDLVPSLGGLLPTPDSQYVLVKRELPPDRTLEVFSARLDLALRRPRSAHDVTLEPRDEVIVFGLVDDRSEPIPLDRDRQNPRAPFGAVPEEREAAALAAERQREFRHEQVLFESTRDRDVSRQFQGDRGRDRETDASQWALARDRDLSDEEKQFLLSREQEFSDETGLSRKERDREFLDGVQTAKLSRERELMEEELVFRLAKERTGIIEPIIDRLRQQARYGSPERVVSVRGRVPFPGDYPLERGMRVSDLIRAGGSFRQDAYTLEAELTRFAVVDGRFREVRRVPINLVAVVEGNEAEDFALQPFDTLQIKQIPEWIEQETVEIVGEVAFPGAYVIRRGETLRELIERAGGPSDLAYPRGSVFSRESLRKKEQAELDRLQERLQADLAALSLEQLQGDKGQESFAMASSLLKELETTPAVGRLVIDLPKILRGEDDVQLRDGDRLFIPRQPQEVTVIGEVNYPTSHLYDPDLEREDYIAQSGGLTGKAAKKNIYVVRANGAVLARQGSAWFSRTRQDMQTGDTIVVPLDAERMRPLTFWTNVSQIVYQLGLAAASAKAVGVF